MEIFGSHELRKPNPSRWWSKEDQGGIGTQARGIGSHLRTPPWKLTASEFAREDRRTWKFGDSELGKPTHY